MFMVNFSLTFHHKYSLTEVEGMIPWERDAYLKLITEYIEMEYERLQLEAAKQRG
jgi:hypothetical protein